MLGCAFIFKHVHLRRGIEYQLFVLKMESKWKIAILKDKGSSIRKNPRGKSKKKISKRKISKRKISKRKISKRKISKRKISKRKISKRKISKRKISKRMISKRKISKKEDIQKEDIQKRTGLGRKKDHRAEYHGKIDKLIIISSQYF